MNSKTTGNTGAKSEDKPQILRETDEEARNLARTLVRGARYMSLAALEAETGFPTVSRVLTGTDLDGAPVILVSALSGHTKALLADPRCALLAGEPQKGDPLAHPRITVQAVAQSVDHESLDHERIRTRFLARHPKAALYVDFPDFRFLRLIPQKASLNGGFARAYSLPGSDLVIRDMDLEDWRDWNDLFVKIGECRNVADEIAIRERNQKEKGWRISGIDPAGIDLCRKDFQLRHEFGYIMASPEIFMNYICNKTNLD